MYATAERQRWLSLLARANAAEMTGLWPQLSVVPEYAVLRPPETGLVMVRGRAGGIGARFNLGEMTATRAAIRLADGTIGHGYVAGRQPRLAEHIAVCDALLQGEASTAPIDDLLNRIEQRLAEAQQTQAAKAAATRVNFSTLSREAT